MPFPVIINSLATAVIDWLDTNSANTSHTCHLQCRNAFFNPKVDESPANTEYHIRETPRTFRMAFPVNAGGFVQKCKYCADDMQDCFLETAYEIQKEGFHLIVSDYTPDGYTCAKCISESYEPCPSINVMNVKENVSGLVEPVEVQNAGYTFHVYPCENWVLRNIEFPQVGVKREYIVIEDEPEVKKVKFEQ